MLQFYTFRTYVWLIIMHKQILCFLMNYILGGELNDKLKKKILKWFFYELYILQTVI